MKNFIITIGSMIKITTAYACALMGMVFGIPGRILTEIGTKLIDLGEKIAMTEQVDNGEQIMSEIADA